MPNSPFSAVPAMTTRAPDEARHAMLSPIRSGIARLFGDKPDTIASDKNYRAFRFDTVIYIQRV
jgi:hypothetical protein